MNDNKYDDFFSDTEESSRTEAFSVGLVLRIILAVTTAGFAFVYGSGLLNWLLPDFLARVATTAVYLFGIDFMAFEWPRLAQKNATTEKQIGIADTGWKVSTAMSVAVTLVFTLLVFSDFITVEGQLADAVNILALVVGIGMPIFQGVWYMRYENASIRSIESRQRAQHGAMKNFAQFTIVKEHERERLGRLVDGVRQQLPNVTRREAAAMQDDYFNSSIYDDKPQPAMNQQEPSTHQPTIIPLDTEPKTPRRDIGFNPENHTEAIADFLSKQENRDTIRRVMEERKAAK